MDDGKIVNIEDEVQDLAEAKSALWLTRPILVAIAILVISLYAGHTIGANAAKDRLAQPTAIRSYGPQTLLVTYHNGLKLEPGRITVSLASEKPFSFVVNGEEIPATRWEPVPTDGLDFVIRQMSGVVYVLQVVVGEGVYYFLPSDETDSIWVNLDNNAFVEGRTFYDDSHPGFDDARLGDEPEVINGTTFGPLVGMVVALILCLAWVSWHYRNVSFIITTSA